MSRVVLAPDSFKGTIRAGDAASALAEGWRAVDPAADLVLRPMADGGEGTLDAFAAAVSGARRVPVVVAPPWGDPRDGGVDAAWLLLPPTPDAPRGTGVVELASTSGIELFGARREPWDASTDGFGGAIAAALDAGVSRLVLAIGSSASTDGGAGLLRALGARFRTAAGGTPPRLGAGAVAHLAGVDLSDMRPLPPGGAIVLTDVTAPLCGPSGAAAVFGPQKGFAAARIADVDGILARYASLFDVDPDTPGAGAAGGAGFGLLAWGAELVPGAAEVARIVGLADAVADASVVVTGEGAFDGQSAAGKAPAHVEALARDAGVPVALVAGRIGPDADTTAFAASVALTDLAGAAGASDPTAAALSDPARWLRAAGAALARSLS